MEYDVLKYPIWDSKESKISVTNGYCIKILYVGFHICGENRAQKP